MNYNRTWSKDISSEDCQGRSIWALGVNCALSRDQGSQSLASNLFHLALRTVLEFRSLRSLAFSIIGIYAYLRKYSGDSEVRRLRKIIDERLFRPFREYASDEWPWFEDTVTYANGVIPHALLLSGQWAQNNEMIDQGLRSLDWLISIQSKEGYFSFIGNNGWYPKNGIKAHFDQQPLEAHALIEACLAAFAICKDKKYAGTAHRAFNWFIGENDLGVALYDYTTAGCRDGLQPDGANFNEGAESTLAWLQSLIAMHYYTAGEDMLRSAE